MDNRELNNLELKVDSLLSGHEHLKNENLALRQQLAKLTQERSALLNKNKQAIHKIKTLIAKLREELI